MDIEVTSRLRDLLFERGLSTDDVDGLMRSLSGFGESELRSMIEEIGKISPPNQAMKVKDFIDGRVKAKKKMSDTIAKMREQSAQPDPKSKNEP